MIRRRRFQAGVVVALCCAGLGCSASESERRILQALEDRAPTIGDSVRKEILRAVTEAGREHGIDPLLLLAVIEVESSYNPRARGPRGAVGLMQVRPATAREVAEQRGYRWRGPEDLLDPQYNVRLGAAYLAKQKQRFRSWETALMAYNMGPQNVHRILARGRKPPRAYSAKVLDRYRRLQTAAEG